MTGFLPIPITAGFLAAVPGLHAPPAARIPRPGRTGGAPTAAPASCEEAFRVTAHECRAEIRAQADREAPLLTPGDHRRRSPGAAGRAGAKARRPPRSRPRRSRSGGPLHRPVTPRPQSGR